MPHGHSSKLWVRSGDYSMEDGQAISAEEKEKTPFFPLICRADIQCSSVAESLVKCKNSQQHTTASVSALCIKSDEDAKIQDDERSCTFWTLSPTSNSSSTVRDEIAVSLVQFMLQKYSMRQPITKEEILKHVILQKEDDFPEILKKASEVMVLAFGSDIKETDATKQRYALVSIIRPNGDEILNGETIQPRSGILMILLCLIFMNGNCANEDYIWEVLSVMGLYSGVNHRIYGNVKKLITKVS
ncbi:melanoma-associated antigen B4-like [Rattus norvegicus]|uniref:melanoma-associated antigen B4-like n=1 Tax=Rattus norvegicus TaxID=10116 RepID=UPI0004E4896C|nr:melanoma-associated antigen B4-like [Rattus norvegicus]|eukprot:XP_008771532.1 PREDICTED: melanoma-associated antigen B4-like [Rattus norvegicus]